jgi:hypothetical protein
MNKNVIIAAFIVIFGLSLFKSKGMIQAAILKKYGSLRSTKFFKVLAALKTLNLSAKQLTFLMSQIMVETGVFSSRSTVFDLNNNASGILYTKSSGQLANRATKGTPRSTSEGGNYAKFENLNDWAKEYFRVLNRKSMPLNANDINDFTNRLKENNYFTDSLETYKKNINFFYNFLINNKF